MVKRGKAEIDLARAEGIKEGQYVLIDYPCGQFPGFYAGCDDRNYYLARGKLKNGEDGKLFDIKPFPRKDVKSISQQRPTF